MIITLQYLMLSTTMPNDHLNSPVLKTGWERRNSPLPLNIPTAEKAVIEKTLKNIATYGNGNKLIAVLSFLVLKEYPDE